MNTFTHVPNSQWPKPECLERSIICINTARSGIVQASISPKIYISISYTLNLPLSPSTIDPSTSSHQSQPTVHSASSPYHYRPVPYAHESSTLQHQISLSSPQSTYQTQRRSRTHYISPHHPSPPSSPAQHSPSISSPHPLRARSQVLMQDHSLASRHSFEIHCVLRLVLRVGDGRRLSSEKMKLVKSVT